MRDNIYKKNYDVKLTKFNIITISLLIFYMMWIPLVILTKESFDVYGWAVNDINSNISITSEGIRIWTLFFSTLILSFSIYSFYLSIELQNRKKYWLGIGLFNWLFLVDSIKESIKYKSWKYYLNYIKQDYYRNSLISFSSLYRAIKFKYHLKKVDKNTILYIITLLCFLTGFIMYNIIVNKENITDTFIFSVISYFTHLSNGLCFFFLLFLPFFQNKIIMNKNSFFINVNSYIMVVAFTFWVFLFPGMIITNQISSYNSFGLTRTIWLHGIDPIIFLIFCINSSRSIERKIVDKYWHALLINLIFPIFYASYAFSLPFLARVSVYGPFTDCNEWGYAYFGNELKKIGTMFSLFMIVVLIIIFSLSLLITRSLIKINRKNEIIIEFTK